jgi:hypothetical protein
MKGFDMQFCGGYILGGLTVAGLAVSFVGGGVVATYCLDKVNAAKNEKAQSVIEKDASELFTKMYKEFFKK